MAKTRVQEEEERELAAAEAEYKAANVPVSAPEGATMDLNTQVQMQMLQALQALAGRADQTAGPTPQEPFASAKFCTPWNPTGTKDRPELARKTWMNGHQLREARLSTEEIDLLNQIKPGKYYNRQWTVVETDEGDGHHSIEIVIPNKTQEQRLALTVAHEGKGLAGICRKILNEQSAIVLA